MSAIQESRPTDQKRPVTRLRDGQVWLRVGQLEFPAWEFTKPHPGIHSSQRFAVEILCRPQIAGEEPFDYELLDGIKSSDIPKGAKLTFASVPFSFSMFDSMNIDRVDTHVRVSLTGTLHFDQFHLPVNLKHFMGDFASRLQVTGKELRALNIEVSANENLGFVMCIRTDLVEGAEVLAAAKSLVCCAHKAYQAAVDAVHESAPTRAQRILYQGGGVGGVLGAVAGYLLAKLG